MQRVHWSSRLGFVLATSGSAVGLGNIWKFPYIVGENGGGAFVLVYLLCILLVAVPVFMAELLLGRRQQRNPITALQQIIRQQNLHDAWQTIGWMGLICSFLLLSFYSVIAGWSLAYIVKMAKGTLSHLDPAAIGQHFSDFVHNPLHLLFWHSIFMFLTVAVVVRGVRQGLERISCILMPGLMLILLILVINGMVQGNFIQAVHFMFDVRLDKLSAESLIQALGHAFFSLSVGMTVIMAYGSYLPKHISIPKVTFSIALLDTLIAMLAGLAVFSLVFAYQLDVDSGPGLVFITLPIAFNQMPLGNIIGLLFFILLFFAALTSAISLMEPVISWITERYAIKRTNAGIMMGSITWFIGIGTVLSFNLWEQQRLFGRWNFFTLLDFLTANLLLPLGGLLLALFTGWVLHKKQVRQALQMDGIGFLFYYQSLRFICPLGILAFFLYALYQSG